MLDAVGFEDPVNDLISFGKPLHRTTDLEVRDAFLADSHVID